MAWAQMQVITFFCCIIIISAVNFDFNCKCQAKSNLPKNLQIPTDANQAAQQQINQLNDQIRRLNEQLRKTQQGQSTFEQFGKCRRGRVKCFNSSKRNETVQLKN